MFGSYRDCWSSCLARHVEFGLDMPMYVPDSRRLFVFLLGAILQGEPAFSQELPDAPSVVRNANFLATEGSDRACDPGESPDTASHDPSNSKFLSRWTKRGLRDQAAIYMAPFHRSELKWAIGLPAVTLGLIAIDKHASGALSRNNTSISTDISDVGLFSTAGAGRRFTPGWKNPRRFSCSRNWRVGSRGYGQQRCGVRGAAADHRASTSFAGSGPRKFLPDQRLG